MSVRDLNSIQRDIIYNLQERKALPLDDEAAINEWVESGRARIFRALIDSDWNELKDAAQESQIKEFFTKLDQRLEDEKQD